jgi:hypothetical protein
MSRKIAAALLVLAASPLVVSCGSASRSTTGNANADETPTVTTIGPSVFDHDSCVATLKRTVVALRAQPSPGTESSSVRLNTALSALLVDACTSAPTAARVTGCLAHVSDEARSITDAGAIALGDAAFALEVTPTTARDQSRALDLAVIRTRVGIESRIRDQVLACS